MVTTNISGLICLGQRCKKIGQNINPKRLGVLEEKKNGWNLLVIDHNEKYFFNAYKKRYEKF